MFYLFRTFGLPVCAVLTLLSSRSLGEEHRPAGFAGFDEIFRSPEAFEINFTGWRVPDVYRGQQPPAPLAQWGHSLLSDIRCDYRNYYTCRTARDLCLGVGIMAAVANTTCDQKFRDWWQDDVRSSGTDSLASGFEPFGRGEIFIPAFAGMAVAGHIFRDRPLGRRCGEFGERVTRGYLVGAPPMLFMQAMLGASRPGEDPVYDSRWKPFDDNNAVSGHAFMGAVPFLTAAQMTDRPILKGGFLFLSTFPAWTRINDDAHYLSQACLGWWMAYLACRAVNDTQTFNRRFEMLPMTEPDTVGIQMVWSR